MTYVFSSLVTVWLVGFYLLNRNIWVYRQRVRLIMNDWDTYKKLPSYDYMMYRKFWVWNINKFL